MFLKWNLNEYCHRYHLSHFRSKCWISWALRFDSENLLVSSLTFYLFIHWGFCSRLQRQIFFTFFVSGENLIFCWCRIPCRVVLCDFLVLTGYAEFFFCLFVVICAKPSLHFWQFGLMYSCRCMRIYLEKGMLQYIFNCFRVCRVLYQRETKIKNPLQSKQTAENIHSEPIFLNTDLPYKTLNEQ